MSRISIPAVANATGDTADVYARVRKIAGGSVPNLFAALGHLAPATLNAALDAEGALAASSLSKQDLETIKLLISEQTGCDYCVAAHVTRQDDRSDAGSAQADSRRPADR
jgi:alkylhydroperoxidase family enzyme